MLIARYHNILQNIKPFVFNLSLSLSLSLYIYIEREREKERERERALILQVRWQNGIEKTYRFGRHGRYDLMIW